MSDFLTYKDKPLVRKGNTVYYGDMSEKYIVKLDILSSHTVDELEISDKIRISLIKNDSEKLDNVKKTTEKNGFAEAMQFATTWLESALAGK